MSALPIRHNTDTLAIFTESGSGKKVSLTEFPAQKRAGKGIAGTYYYCDCASFIYSQECRSYCGY